MCQSRLRQCSALLSCAVVPSSSCCGADAAAAADACCCGCGACFSLVCMDEGVCGTDSSLANWPCCLLCRLLLWSGVGGMRALSLCPVAACRCSLLLHPVVAACRCRPWQAPAQHHYWWCCCACCALSRFLIAVVGTVQEEVLSSTGYVSLSTVVHYKQSTHLLPLPLLMQQHAAAVGDAHR